MPGLTLLSRWLLLGEWRAHPVRALVAVAAIAVGVAMGFAIHLINAAAFNEFSAAVKSLSGQADIQVAGREPLFDEAVYPRLAGQTEGYLRKQLADFASGEREDPTMTPFALSLSEREFDAIVAHFSKMKPQPNKTFHADPVRVQRGEALAKASNCAACHGQQLEGKGEFPRLAGQGVDYLAEQLAHFKNGARRDSTGAMPAIAGTLSQQDIEDLAHYAASR